MQNKKRIMTIENIEENILCLEGKNDKESQDYQSIYKDYLYRCVAYTIENSFPFVLATAKDEIVKQEAYLSAKTNHLSIELEQAKKLRKKSIPEFMEKYSKIFDLLNIASSSNNINNSNTLDKFITEILNQIQLSEDPSFNDINTYTFGPYLKVTMSTKSTSYLIQNHDAPLVRKIVELAYCRWLVYHFENNHRYELSCLLEEGKNKEEFEYYKANLKGLKFLLTKDKPLQELIGILTKLIINYEYYESLNRENQQFLIQHRQFLNYLHDPIYYVCDVLSQANALGVPFERVPEGFYESVSNKVMIERQVLAIPQKVEDLSKENIFATLKQNEEPIEKETPKL